jgi:predicted phosphatase
MNKPIAIDFDNVLHDYDGWKDGTIYGKPVKDSVKMTKLLVDRGFKLVVFTTREDTKAVSKWLQKNGFVQMDVTNVKPIAVAYIDDRGIRFTNWEDIVKYFI